ncbi:MAG: DUF362 domain-containing protein [Deferrisomatales bacterium]|nr:DUF362 domain-containing protein [Deferrisomatales bacterium]
MPKPLHWVPFTTCAASIPAALEAVGAPSVLARQRRILVKPNLVNASPPPVTLPCEAVKALVLAIRRWSAAEIRIGEGTGDAALDTGEVFRRLGYVRVARELGVELVDLNEAPLVELSDPQCSVFLSLWLPRVVVESFVVSFAVLKAHSLAGVTLSLKNMMGCAPPSRYGHGGTWKKSAFHRHMHASVYELNRYRRPDLALVDASVGLAEHHLGGRTCEPPLGRILAGFDPVAVDAEGARLLGIDWREVEYLRRAHGGLGKGAAEPT